VIVVLLSAIVVLLFVTVVLFVVFGLKILAFLRRFACFYEEKPVDIPDGRRIDLMLLRPKTSGHKTRKPTDRSREWMENRAKDSREVK
jgi:hypothetical protein